jgi:anti-sigma28 factor (negative regulator of flagellin synthesis)
MINQANSMTGSSVLTPDEDDNTPVHDTAQLSKLSSVLNGLEGGAQAMQRHIQEAMRAIKEGTYRVDPVKLSQRIVGEALRTV